MGQHMLLFAPTLPLGTTQAPPQHSGGGFSDEECKRTCGDVPIPYPFGFGPLHCSMTPGFYLNCNDTVNGIYKPFIANVELLNISLKSGQVQVMNYISSYCKNASGLMEQNTWYWNLTGSPYTLSDPSNMFIVIGCKTLAYLSGTTNSVDGYMTGCVSFWPKGNYPTNGSCSGMGCCQTAIPTGLRYYKVWFQEGFDPSAMNSSCNCSYAVLMDSSKFSFSTSYLTSSKFNDSFSGRVPMMLQWAIGNESCDFASKNEEYACISDNSECSNAVSGQGYICKCREGFEGNPYLTGPNGCTDINECLNPKEHGCYGECINEPAGKFRCICPAGSRGNASVYGSCHEDLLSSLGTRLGIGVGCDVAVDGTR